jgi:hypothetical protein
MLPIRSSRDRGLDGDPSRIDSVLNRLATNRTLRPLQFGQRQPVCRRTDQDFLLYPFATVHPPEIEVSCCPSALLHQCTCLVKIDR